MIAFSTAFTALFAGWSLALADMLRMILQDLEDHSSAWSSFELTSRMSTSSEPSQERSFQNDCLCVHIARVIFVPKIYTIENFREFNFRCWLDLRKYFNTERLPIHTMGLACMWNSKIASKKKEVCNKCIRSSFQLFDCREGNGPYYVRLQQWSGAGLERVNMVRHATQYIGVWFSLESVKMTNPAVQSTRLVHQSAITVSN